MKPGAHIDHFDERIAEDLGLAVELGWFSFFARPLLWMLKLFSQMGHVTHCENWNWLPPEWRRFSRGAAAEVDQWASLEEPATPAMAAAQPGPASEKRKLSQKKSRPPRGGPAHS